MTRRAAKKLTAGEIIAHITVGQRMTSAEHSLPAISLPTSIAPVSSTS